MPMHGHSEACCNTPAVAVDYKEKGKFITVNGMKTYTTGPASASTAILVAYDIFGFFPQTLQGADLLAHADDEHHQYQVFMPDLLNGNYADVAWFPPDTEDKKKKLGDFFAAHGDPTNIVKSMPDTLKEIERQSPAIKQWAGLGYCWGGKVITLCAQGDSAFKAIGSVHPAMVDHNDAKGLKIPVCMLASGDEPADDIKKFEETLSGPKHVETFKDQVHGWMAARADLKQARVKDEYQRGYKTLLDFYHKYV